MGQTQTKESVQSSKPFDEPQTFMTRAVSADFRLSVIKTDHVRVGLEALVVPVDKKGEHVRLIHHWLARGAEMDMVEDLLERTKLYDDLVEGGIKEKEYKIKDAHLHTTKLVVYFIKFPRYSGKFVEVERLAACFKEILEKAKFAGLKQIGFPACQASTIMTFPRGLFCSTMAKESIKLMKHWKATSMSSQSSAASSKMNVIFLASENSGCRIMCKELIELCEQEDVNEEDFADDLDNSSIEYLEVEKDKVNIKKIKGIKEDDDEEEKLRQQETRGHAVTRKSFLKSVVVKKSFVQG